jgi:chromosome segregation ATPase
MSIFDLPNNPPYLPPPKQVLTFKGKEDFLKERNRELENTVKVLNLKVKELEEYLNDAYQSEIKVMELRLKLEEERRSREKRVDITKQQLKRIYNERLKSAVVSIKDYRARLRKEKEDNDYMIDTLVYQVEELKEVFESAPELKKEIEFLKNRIERYESTVKVLTGSEKRKIADEICSTLRVYYGSDSLRNRIIHILDTVLLT